MYLEIHNPVGYKRKENTKDFAKYLYILDHVIMVASAITDLCVIQPLRGRLNG